MPFSQTLFSLTDFSLQVHTKNEDPQDEKDSERRYLQQR